VYENKRTLLFRSPIESQGDLTKDDIAYDLEWSLTVISDRPTINDFTVWIKNNYTRTICVMYEVNYSDDVIMWAIISTVLFNGKDCYYMMLSAIDLSAIVSWA